MTPTTNKDEAQTRAEIDTKLEAAVWATQGKKRLNLHKNLGAAAKLS